METQIAQKVEGSIASIGNIHHQQTCISEGNVLIIVEFNIGTPIDRAVTDVRDAIARVRADLPQGILEPQVQREDADGGTFAIYAVTTTNMTPEQLSWSIDNTITKRLLGVSGVAQVQRIGGADREIRVELDPSRMQALGLTAVQVNEQLRQLNVDAPGGRAQVGGGEQAIRVLGGAKSAAALATRSSSCPGANRCGLTKLPTYMTALRRCAVWRGLTAVPPRHSNFTSQKGVSDVSTAEGVAAELAKIQKDNPSLHIQQIFTTVQHTIKTYHSALEALIEGSMLAVVVVWLFLRNWRATLISALAIPLSAIPTFAFMQWMGFTLNEITLLSLSLVAGVLVDDAIVEIENIVRHMRMGKSGFRAAMEAADEIGLAVVATSFTIIAVFLPVSFMGGLSGQFFKQFGLTVAAAVFISLLVARMITPVLAAYALNRDAIPHRDDGPIMSTYVRALKWCVANRWKTIGFGTLFFALSLGGGMFLPKAFVPPEDFSTSIFNIELPPGGKLEDTAASVRQRHRHLAQAAGSDRRRRIRRHRFRRSAQRANVFVSMVPRNKRKASAKEFEQRMMPQLNQVPDGRMNFQNFGGSAAAAISRCFWWAMTRRSRSAPDARCWMKCAAWRKFARRASMATCRDRKSSCIHGSISRRNWA